MRAAIPWCIGVLLFLAMLRLIPNSTVVTAALSMRQWVETGVLVVVSQVLLPVLVYLVGSQMGIPSVWLLAATLVCAAPPISGSPNLVMLLRGDGGLAMRWLMLGTALLPLTCLPVLLLLFPAQSISIMIRPSVVLLMVIAGAVLLAIAVMSVLRARSIQPLSELLDGASAVVLAVMVIGLMSAVHDPETTASDISGMLLLAVVVNAGLQCSGVWVAKVLRRSKERSITLGVVLGNRNVALYLTALPALQIEPLLLFIACYQVPMYLTPLIGDGFYRRME